MLGRKTARILDDTAHVAMTAGKRVAGATGERLAATVVDAVLGPVRDRCDEDCTRCARGICDGEAR